MVRGLNFIGDLSVDSGLGEAARLTYSAALRRGIPLSYIELNYLFPPRTVKDMDGRYRHLPIGSQYPVNLLYINIPQVVELTSDMLYELTCGKYTIGYWVWELPEIPERYHVGFERVNEIWTASHFCYDIFSRATQVPVTVVPHPIELEPVREVRREKFGIGQDRYVFLCTFAASSSDARKNPWGVIEAFEKAFGRSAESKGKDGPLLVMKAHHVDLFPELHTDLRAALDRVGGILLDQSYSRQELNELIACCDVYVSLHRSEGFGLGIAEAMYCGKPVVATNYSGNIDFMTAQNSYLVPFTLAPLRAEDFRYNPFVFNYYGMGQLWAEPDVNCAAEWMAYLYENPDEGRAHGEIAAADVRRLLSMQTVGEIMASRLREIAL